jgi:hypothetical protein
MEKFFKVFVPVRIGFFIILLLVSFWLFGFFAVRRLWPVHVSPAFAGMAVAGVFRCLIGEAVRGLFRACVAACGSCMRPLVLCRACLLML